jgi:hypothetical protein
MKPRILIFALVPFSLSAFAGEVAIDIPALAGKTKSEVVTLLGEPKDCGPSENGESCYYPDVDTVIFYNNGKVARATVNTINRVEKMPLDESALEHLGLKLEKPTMKDKAAIIWCPIQGLKCVALLRGRAVIIFAE